MNPLAKYLFCVVAVLIILWPPSWVIMRLVDRRRDNLSL